jgi:hypothetical protein
MKSCSYIFQTKYLITVMTENVNIPKSLTNTFIILCWQLYSDACFYNHSHNIQCDSKKMRTS